MHVTFRNCTYYWHTVIVGDDSLNALKSILNTGPTERKHNQSHGLTPSSWEEQLQ